MKMQMRNRSSVAYLVIVLACMALAQQPATQGASSMEKKENASPAQVKLKELLESKVKAEWEAFKNKDKKAYSDLLADDFAAVEDDSQGMRTKSAAAAEVDRSVVSNYFLFALNVIPLEPNAALVTYEITMEFPAKAQVRFKRVLVSELWLQRDGQWKARYYQETRVK
ncbi:MAG TPA: nuclear transport factor 2 family protein [Candidatus Angelobacter sp.]